jgi:hypothetical protein
MSTNVITRLLVALANTNDAVVDGPAEAILRLIAANDVVFAVWKDRAAPDGVGTLIVKGANRMRDIAATGVSMKCCVAAINCDTYEQAKALRQRVDTDRTH